MSDSLLRNTLKLVLLVSLVLFGELSSASADENCHVGEKLAISKNYRNAVALIVSSDKTGGNVLAGTIFRIGPNRFLSASHVASDGFGVFKKTRPKLKIAPLQSVVDPMKAITAESPSFELRLIDQGNPTNRSKDWALLEIDTVKNDWRVVSQVLNAMPILPIGHQSHLRTSSAVAIGFPGKCAVRGSMVLVAAEGALKSPLEMTKPRWWERLLLFYLGTGENVEIALGHASPGSSGAPVIVEQEGLPYVIGILVTGVGNGETAFGFVPLDQALVDRLASSASN